MKNRISSIFLIALLLTSSCSVNITENSSDLSSDEIYNSALLLPENDKDSSSETDSSSSEPSSSSKKDDSKNSASSSYEESKPENPVSSSSRQDVSIDQFSSKDESSSSVSSSKPSEIVYQPAYEISEFYGRLNLSENEITAYDTILHSIRAHISEVDLRAYSLTKDSLQKIMRYVVSDHPDIIGLDKQYEYYTSSGKVTRLSLIFSYEADEREQKLEVAETKALSIINSLKSKSTYNKIKGAHDWIINNTEYDTEAAALGSSQSDAYNMYGVFVNKKAVCEGYSKAFQYLMYKLGVPCLVVYGKNNAVNHSWNLVSVDGVYYHIDVTQDDPIISSGDGDVISYSYFLINDSEIAVTHSIQQDGSNYPLPTASSSAMNFYVKEGRYITAYNRDNIVKIISADVKNENAFSYIRFRSKADLDEAVSKLGDFRDQVENDTKISFIMSRISSNSSPVYDLILRLKY